MTHASLTPSRRVLALNAGSSSIKLRLLEIVPDGGDPRTVRGGIVDGLGGDPVLRLDGGEASRVPAARDHATALRLLLERLAGERIDAVGHRVVHGGERFVTATRIDDRVLAALAALASMAPLHNPPSLAVIRAASEVLGADLPMVAVFDTAFHATIDEAARAYAIPSELAAKHGIRRFGFHGLAHASLAAAWSAATGRPLSGSRLVTLQLGNGCSAAAIRDGRSIDTSMGMTPLEGLVMGTRSGDLDPAVVTHLARAEGLSPDGVERLLNERSGLLGLTGRSKSMKDVIEASAAGDARARLALDVFCRRARRYIGGYLTLLEGADAVVLGGGIGERSPAVRERLLAGMEWCGLTLDSGANARVTGLDPGATVRLSRAGSRIEAWAAGVDEEAALARETAACLGWTGAPRP